MAYLFSSDKPKEPVDSSFEAEPFVKPTDLFYTSKVIVQLVSIRRSAHGVTYEFGDSFYCWCSLEGREQQAGMFSISGSEDKNPQTSGGLREVTVKQILAREWHGDIHTFVWIHGDLYDVDGAPEHRRHGKTHHWEIRVRRAADLEQIPEEYRLHQQGLYHLPFPNQGLTTNSPEASASGLFYFIFLEFQEPAFLPFRFWEET